MEHDALVARINALEAELERLKAEATSRRDMFKKLALAGAGAVAGGAMAAAPTPAGATPAGSRCGLTAASACSPPGPAPPCS